MSALTRKAHAFATRCGMARSLTRVRPGGSHRARGGERSPRNPHARGPLTGGALGGPGGRRPHPAGAPAGAPAEGEGLTDPGQGIKEAVAMPEPLRHAIAAFVA